MQSFSIRGKNRSRSDVCSVLSVRQEVARQIVSTSMERPVWQGQDALGMTPTLQPPAFMFATGIENSAPTIRNGRVRIDELEKCGHYKHWKTDFQLVKEMD